MKIIITTLFLSLIAFTILNAQEKKPLSPAMSTSATVGDTEVTIDYNAPSMRGRALWGDLVPFGRVWRTGANGATKISFDKDLKIKGETLTAGTYAIFTIPDEKVWTVIFNTDANQWGSNNYDKSKDALRIEVVPGQSEETHEVMNFNLEDGGLNFSWDQLTFQLSLSE